LRKGLHKNKSKLAPYEISVGTQFSIYILFPVPESEGNVLVTVCVANAGNAVLAPPVCPRSGVLMREVCISRSEVKACQYQKLKIWDVQILAGSKAYVCIPHVWALHDEMGNWGVRDALGEGMDGVR